MTNLLGIFLLVPLFSWSQEKQLIAPSDSKAGQFIICNMEEPATIDSMTWLNYLERNISLDNLPDTVSPGCYTILVQFIIDKQGKITDILIVKDTGCELGRRAADVVAHYPGLWKPAMRNGRPVKSYHRQPITFTIADECEEDKLPVESML